MRRDTNKGDFALGRVTDSCKKFSMHVVKKPMKNRVCMRIYANMQIYENVIGITFKTVMIFFVVLLLLSYIRGSEWHDFIDFPCKVLCSGDE